MLKIKKGLEGMGVFSDKYIEKNKNLFVFSNKIIKINHRKGCDCKICRRCIQIGKSDWLYPNRDSLGWYLNHSCNPSSGIRGNKIISIKKIKKDKEITIDYSTTNTDKKWKMVCMCGEKNCRKIIRSVQFLPENKFIFYKNIMPSFVAESYKH
jgi:uncharacterized protein